MHIWLEWISCFEVVGCIEEIDCIEVIGCIEMIDSIEVINFIELIGCIETFWTSFFSLTPLNCLFLMSDFD